MSVQEDGRVRPQRPRRWHRLIVLLVAAASAGGGACSRGETPSERNITSPTSTAPAPSGLERIRVRDITLGTGETVGIGFHPTVQPAKLVVTPRSSGLEVCPGDGMAKPVADPGASGWGDAWPAGDCRALETDGTLRLPGRSEHLSVVIVNKAPREARIAELRLVYDQQDYLNRPSPHLEPASVLASGRRARRASRQRLERRRLTRRGSEPAHSSRAHRPNRPRVAQLRGPGRDDDLVP